MTKTVRERLISTAFSIGLLFVGGLFSHFFWQKETNTTKINRDIEILKETKLDKDDFKEHVQQQKTDREKDNAAVIQAIKDQGKETREWIELTMKKYK